MQTRHGTVSGTRVGMEDTRAKLEQNKTSIRPHKVCPNCGEDVAPEGSRGAFCSVCRFPLAVLKDIYRLDAVIAEGGFGVVYLATASNRDKPCVIKIIKPEVFKLEGMERRFHREVRITQKLSRQSPHIIQILDHGSDNYLGHYYVMEHLHGMHLGKLLRENRLTAQHERFHVFRQLCEALMVSHSNGVIHRDLKPENVFVLYANGDPHFVKLLDFGIAKPMDATTRASLTQGVLGTPFYMPPEQFTNQGVDHRSDIYSLGVMLYEILSGTLPFGEGNMSVMMFRHMMEDPTPIQTHRPDLPDGLSHAVMKAMAKKSKQRFQTVREFWDALAPYAAEEGEVLSPSVENLPYQTTMLPQTPSPAPFDALQPEGLANLPNTGPHQGFTPETRDRSAPSLSPTSSSEVPWPKKPETEFYLRPPDATSHSQRNVILLITVLFLLLGAAGGVIWKLMSSPQGYRLVHVEKPLKRTSNSSVAANQGQAKLAARDNSNASNAPQTFDAGSPKLAPVKDPDDDDDDEDDDDETAVPSRRRNIRKVRRRKRVKRTRRRRRVARGQTRRSPPRRKAPETKRPQPLHPCGKVAPGFRWVTARLYKPRGLRARVELSNCRGCRSVRRGGKYCLKLPTQRTVSIRVSAQGQIACRHKVSPTHSKIGWKLQEAAEDSLIDENYNCATKR